MNVRVGDSAVECEVVVEEAGEDLQAGDPREPPGPQATD